MSHSIAGASFRVPRVQSRFFVHLIRPFFGKQRLSILKAPRPEQYCQVVRYFGDSLSVERVCFPAIGGGPGGSPSIAVQCTAWIMPGQRTLALRVYG